MSNIRNYKWFNRFKKLCNIKQAAILSIILARDFLEISEEIRLFSAATVDNLSSHKHIQFFVDSEIFEAKDLVDWHLGPSVPFILIGKPRIIPVNWYFFSKSLIFSRSSENFFLLITITGLAIVLDSSDMATPIVLVPRSKPTSGPLLFIPVSYTHLRAHETLR